MKFLADMGISMDTVQWLRLQGHDAIHLSEERLHKMSDDIILIKSKNEGRVLLTCDLDFGHLLANSKEISPSVIIFRLEFQTATQHIEKLKKILSVSNEILLAGTIISVSDKKIRSRKLPVN
ncbi:MAG: DUF5615 family PIN-like protein [Bacteroidetes bacterium]|nr:DUF5615 family PIN-like protein [Bacteroidota bacterium]